MQWIAHRAGNDPSTISPALATADAVELDVHLLRGRLEVRHSKAVWPMRVYWEQGHGILTDERPPELTSVLSAAPDGAHLWFDIKAFTPRLTHRVMRTIGDRLVATMSSRSWWVLRPAQQRGDIRTCRSIGSRLQLWVALRIDHPDGVGIPERFATPDVIGRLAARASFVAVWGARDLRRIAELVDARADVLIIDDLGLIDADRDDRDDR